MGIHHSGVEILGREYSFASGGGIFDSSPKDAPGAKFRESIGKFNCRISIFCDTGTNLLM